MLAEHKEDPIHLTSTSCSSLQQYNIRLTRKPQANSTNHTVKMAGLFNNNDQKNNTDSITDGATGVAKTGTGSKSSHPT